ncbi:EGF-like domain-containing protein 2 [Haliotis asinina]|uniref:EGF-like domain-containing protein 2 n=1 Tax=Haliotis asinina TaxID=109174 RepID=UPI0035318435
MSSLPVLVLTLFLGLARTTFDCRRPNQDCLNSGTCTFTSADCICTSAYSGYDCALELAIVDQRSCTSMTCVNGGTCYDDGTGANCYCDREHYGDRCEKDRYTLSCVADLMIIGINPYSAAGYEAFVEDKQGVTGCGSQAVPNPVSTFDKIPDSWEGHYIQVEHDSAACGPSVPVVTGNRKDFDRVVVVKYSPGELIYMDDRYKVKCILENNVFVDSSVVKINVTGADSQHVVSREDVAKAVDFYLYVGDFLYNGDIVDAGAELKFLFGVQGVYTSLRVEEGEANNTVTNDAQTLKLIEGSCVHADGRPFVSGAVTPDTSNSRLLTLLIKAFHFDGNDEVIFSFRVKVCVAADNSACDPVNCTTSNGERGYGRRKRDAGNEVNLYKVVKIRGQGESSDQTSISACETSWGITTALSVVAVAIFILIFISAVLIVIIIFLISYIAAGNPRLIYRAL